MPRNYNPRGTYRIMSKDQNGKPTVVATFRVKQSAYTFLQCHHKNPIWIGTYPVRSSDCWIEKEEEEEKDVKP